VTRLREREEGYLEASGASRQLNRAGVAARDSSRCPQSAPRNGHDLKAYALPHGGEAAYPQASELPALWCARIAVAQAAVRTRTLIVVRPQFGRSAARNFRRQQSQEVLGERSVHNLSSEKIAFKRQRNSIV
jgi:hypothetical protein